MSWTSIRSNPPGVRRTAAFITTSLCVPRRPNRLASPDGRCRWHSCSRIPFLRLLMFLVFVFSCCFTPHFNPIELRCICGSPILSNHCLFVRIYDLMLHCANRRLCLVGSLHRRGKRTFWRKKKTKRDA